MHTDEKNIALLGSSHADESKFLDWYNVCLLLCSRAEFNAVGLLKEL